VETTLSTVHDVKVTAKIQDELTAKGRLPEIQLVDEGYKEIDLARTHLQETASAVANNLIRLFDWLTGERPQATRRSPFLALATQTRPRQ
jgi:hypothetical protein